MRVIALAAVLFLLAVSASWGSAGAVSRPPTFKGVGHGSVTSISCASPGNCAAGGYFGEDEDREAFVVSERRGRWGKAIEVPGTATLNLGGEAEVTSISCAAPGECAAGGSYYDSDNNRQAFVVSERKGRWGKAIEVPGTAKANTNGDAGVESISCSAPGECTAGGSYKDGDFQSKAFVVRQTNGHWRKAIKVPGVATLNGGDYATVTSISCVAPGKCAAGGSYTDSALAVEQAFVVSERNGRWGKAIKVPGTATLNGGRYAYVSAVSCATAGNCVAAGVYTDWSGQMQAFIADETRGTWRKAITVPGLATLNRGGVGFSSVSCASAGNCAGGGWYIGGSGHYHAFVVDEKNGTWGAAIKVPGGRNARVDSISCATAGNCAAGGVYTDGSYSRVFVASETKGRWGKAIVVPGMAKTPSDEAAVNSISCPAAGDCAAGGYVANDTHGERPFVVSERNGRWGHAIHKRLPGAIPPSDEQPSGGRPPQLSHVKTRWRATVAKLPANAATGEDQHVDISSISCASPGNCTAVGIYIDDAGYPQGLLLTEKAGHWARGVEAVLPANADFVNSLDSVSCASAGNCTAVGTYNYSTGDIYGEGATSGLLLTETAGHWAPGVEAVLPADAASFPYVLLHSVSCVSAGNCTAVGSYVAGSGDIYSEGGRFGLLLTEEAGHWAPGVAYGDSDGDVLSVSCTSDGGCSAVGYDNYEEHYCRDCGFSADRLLLTKNAGSWGRAAAPFGSLFPISVSCASSGNCSAIGIYYPPRYGIDVEAFAGGVALTEKAGIWRVVETKPPRNAYSADSSVGVVGISCGSPGDCGAMGNYYGQDDSFHLALLNEKAGKWRRGVEARLPRGADYPLATAISCASAGNCTVVGAYLRNPADIYSEDRPRGLLLTEIAGRWARGVRPPLATRFSFERVSAVSCASARRCGAVGIAWNSDGVTHGVLLDSTTPPCVVPRLKGKTVPEARQSIYSHNCSVGTIEHARSQTIEARHVISQTPWAGRHRPPGTKVNLTVSSGP